MERYWVTHCEWHSNLKDASADDGRDVEVVLYADAQATVEALQREVMHLDKTLADVYAQRDGLQRERDVLRRQVDTQRRTIQRYQASHDEHTQLQALVETIKCELFDRYDGAPDSPTRWMGSLIRDIEIAQALPATPTESGQG